MTDISRRQLLAGGVAIGGAAVGLATWRGLVELLDEPAASVDPAGLLDLPAGFRYRILSDGDSKLPGGAAMPGDFDGMAAYSGPRGTVVLVRNHELTGGEGPPVPGRSPYDPDEPGGTTVVVVGDDRAKLDEFVGSSGSRTNCAGGRTPWGSWLTCEETTIESHGYVFEVTPDEPENALSRTPIMDMGRFSHEAIGLDPATGVAYLTEDGAGGSDEEGGEDESFLYRYLPADRGRRPGRLQRGGTLQALAVDKPGGMAGARARAPLAVVWKNVEPAQAHEAARGAGAARFRRLEGAAFAGGALWFADTSGGDAGIGQIYRYTPRARRLELFYEARDSEAMRGPDNVVVSPWGDLWFVEDTDGENRVKGITPRGRVYEFARCRLPGAALAGPTFAPDGSTFFVNLQDPPVTFAVWGPFDERTAGWRPMALAPPPARFAPSIPPALAGAVEQGSLTGLEAAALDRLVARLR